MTPRTILTYLAMIRRLGVRRTLAVLRHNSSERYHERRLGIDTAGVVGMQELGIDNSGHGEYGPTPFRDFHAMFNLVPIRAGHDVLIDYGSGKGRALILAASYPFRRIIGVEFSKELNDVAETNLAAARQHLQCPEVVTVVTDARRFVVPPEVTVAYFNNPFDRPLFEDVLAQLRASVAAHPRRVHVVLSYPPDSLLPPAIAACGWLTVERELALEADRRCIIAASSPDEGGRPGREPRGVSYSRDHASATVSSQRSQ
jgi:hypothetical protein